MLKTIFNYLPTRRKTKLFKQWVDNASLPDEEIPPELRNDRSEEEDLTLHPARRERVYESATPISIDRGMVSLPLKYVLLGISIITLQLVILSVISTVLIMHSP